MPERALRLIKHTVNIIASLDHGLKNKMPERALRLIILFIGVDLPMSLKNKMPERALRRHFFFDTKKNVITV